VGRLIPSEPPLVPGRNEYVAAVSVFATAPSSECYVGHLIHEDLIALRGIHENRLFSGMDNNGLVRSDCADCSALCV
jgi:hypothetical protein